MIKERAGREKREREANECTSLQCCGVKNIEICHQVIGINLYLFEFHLLVRISVVVVVAVVGDGGEDYRISGGNNDACMTECLLQNYNKRTRTQMLVLTHSWSDD